MPIRAVVFDIGGVLEITPPTGWDAAWERRLQLQPGQLNQRMRDVWLGGSVGTIAEAEVERSVGQRLGLSAAEVAAFMDDLWAEYLGTPNDELIGYFASLRPRYRTGILSNSFVGARRKEQQRYRFHELCDLIIYSHEEGLKKPDPRFYALACARLQVQPAEMLFLDDIDVCVEGARACGIQAIRFESNRQAIAAIEHHLRQGASRSPAR